LLCVAPSPSPSVDVGGTGGAPTGGSGASPTARPAGVTTGVAAPASVWAPVTAIAVEAAPVARGPYNPPILDGGVVVDGFAASTWAAAVAPGVAAVVFPSARTAIVAGWGGVVGGLWLPAVGGARVRTALGGRPLSWCGEAGVARPPV